jgi:hypothetical protein
MIQFNIKRFGKMAMWSLTNDKNFYTKQALTMLAVTMFIFVVSTTGFFQVSSMSEHGASQAYQTCFIATLAAFLITIITGPSWMFSSMKGKHDLQTLLMLPASNFEKFLMRYATWLVLLPLYLAAFFVADLTQYLVNVLLGNDYVMFVTQKVCNIFTAEADLPTRLWVSIFVTGFWLHSCYTLGGTFFRSHKYAWILTTIALIVLLMIQMSIFTYSDYQEMKKEVTTMDYDVMDFINLAWAMLNFWLSYRIFCRTKNIARFVNI